MKRHHFVFAIVVSFVSANARAQDGLVKVTSIGSVAGELCFRDRALLFEDPTGVRILYDPGFMTDETDTRLGDVHAVLLSHGHSDHIDMRRDSQGICGQPGMGTGTAGTTNPHSNVATIAVAKNAAVITSSETIAFLTVKMQNLRGTATPACPTAGLDDETVVPLASGCTAAIGIGGTRSLRRAGSGAPVRITAVQAIHPNNIPAQIVDAPGVAPGVSVFGGLSQGFILHFTTGLRIYLTGDTGMFADMEHIIGKLYAPHVVVINIGPGGTGPTSLNADDAARVIQSFIRPTTVMPSHVGEQATSGGVLRSQTWTERFVRAASPYANVVLPLSGVTLSFDSSGRCIGCAR